MMSIAQNRVSTILGRGRQLVACTALVAATLVAATVVQAQTTQEAPPVAPAQDSVTQASPAAPAASGASQSPAPAQTPSAPTGRLPQSETPQAPAENNSTSPAPAASGAAPTTTPATQPVPPSTEPAPAAPTTPSVDPAVGQPAPQATDIVPATAGEEVRDDLPHNLSPWGMFMAADWVVKGVMIGLALASLITWTVWVAKSLELAGARTRAGRTIKAIRKSRTLGEAVQATEGRGGPAAAMLRAAAEEVEISEAAIEHAEGDGVKERVSSVLSRIEAYAGRRMARGTGVLATIGSVGPFVGLFGTVWGIMNSFIGISESNTTNLAVVAPGIAEALLATAIGLVAAIPAVVIYNLFARSVTGYRQLLADAAAGVERLVSRDLDFRKIPPGSRSKPVSLVAGE